MTESEVEKRYAPEIPDKEVEEMRKTIMDRSAKMIDENIERMKKMPNRPKGMQYFDEIAKFFGRRSDEIKAAKEEGKKIVGTLCMMVPYELIDAAGAIPLRVESGFYDPTKIGDRICPVEVCPVARSTVGSAMINLSPYFEQCDVIVCPTTCDSRTKMGEILGDYKKTWTLSPPRMKDSVQAKAFWLEETKDFKKKIEDLTKTKITTKSLRAAIDRRAKATKAFRRLDDLRKGDPVIMGRDAMMVNQMAWIDDLPRWTQKTEELCDELDKRVAEKSFACPPETPRVMFTGTPMIWPDNWKIPNLVEESKPQGVIVCDEACSSGRFLHDPVGVDENTTDDMLIAVAERYVMPCTCPCFTSDEGNADRINLMKSMLKDFRVDGVIYHMLRGCHLYSMEYARVKRVLSKEKMPVYYLDTEYSREDVGQMRVRVEAFLEMLQSGTEADALY